MQSQPDSFNGSQVDRLTEQYTFYGQINSNHGTDSYKAKQITEYFASLNDQEKTEFYTAILSTPSEEYLNQTANAYWEKYTTRDSMIELAADTASFDKDAAEENLEDYSDDELHDLLKEQLKNLITQKYAEQAEAQGLQIRTTASEPHDMFDTQGCRCCLTFDQMMAGVTDEATLAAYYDAYMPSI